MFMTLPSGGRSIRVSRVPPSGAPIPLNHPPRPLPRLARYPPTVAPSAARLRPPDLAGDCQRQRFGESDVPRQDEDAVVAQKRNRRTPRGSAPERSSAVVRLVCRRAFRASEILDHQDRTFLQFEVLGDFTVDPLGFRVCEQSLDPFAVRFPIGKRDRPVDLASIGAHPALTNARRDYPVPFQVGSAFPENFHVLGIALPPRNDHDRHRNLPSIVSRSWDMRAYIAATCPQV